MCGLDSMSHDVLSTTLIEFSQRQLRSFVTSYVLVTVSRDA
jgi:hypothetical protein